MTKPIDRWTLTESAKAQIPAWNARWREIVLSTEPLDWPLAENAMLALYAAVGLPRPRVVRVLSPMMGAAVWAAAAIYWRDRIRAATGAATDAATDAATRAATDAATDAATRAATDAATRAATDAATHAATYAATYAATHAETHAATRAATDAATDEATDEATRAVSALLGRDCTVSIKAMLSQWLSPYNGGCEWAAWCGYLSFVRDVIGWRHPVHEKYAAYENAAVHAGPRFMHPEFCLVSERASIRRLGSDGRLHCDDGPAIGWRCGTQYYYLDGIQVDEQIVMRPGTQTVAQIDGERNADVRSIRLQRFGWPRYLSESGATQIDPLGAARRNDIEGTREALYETAAGERRLVVTCPTGRTFAMGVPREIVTCQAAQAWLNNGRRILART